MSTITFIPLVNNQHWFFRIWDFGRIQTFIITFILILIGFTFCNYTSQFLLIFAFLFISFLYNLNVLLPYISFSKRKKTVTNHSQSISILSANVYQFNTNYQPLLKQIKLIKPDILLTIESNKDWGKALSAIEKQYPNTCKVPLENTYGMHFYSKLPIKKSTVNYFIANDIPSLEIELETKDGDLFTIFGVHPPPPSPTEENTSEERDGELLKIAQKVNKTTNPTIVIGDFNNVAWAKSSKLFAKTSKLIDARVGRGFISTYHAKYWFLRFPIDLVYHSQSINISTLKAVANIDSDHLPLYCQFQLNNTQNKQQKPENLTSKEREEVKDLIEKGIEKDGNRDKIATED